MKKDNDVPEKVYAFYKKKDGSKHLEFGMFSINKSEFKEETYILADNKEIAEFIKSGKSIAKKSNEVLRYLSKLTISESGEFIQEGLKKETQFRAKLILNKLVDEGYAYNNDGIYFITLNGLQFIQNGGYVWAKWKSIINFAFKALGSFAIVAGTVFAAYFQYTQEYGLKKQVQSQALLEQTLRSIIKNKELEIKEIKKLANIAPVPAEGK